MQEQVQRLALANHFTFPVYPFVHRLSLRDLIRSAGTLGERWRPWWNRLDDAQVATALDDTNFLLPYARSIVFPGTVGLQGTPRGPRNSHHAKLIRRWPQDGLSVSCRHLPAPSVPTLTLSPGDPARIGSLTVAPYGAEPDDRLPATIDWVD